MGATHFDKKMKLIAASLASAVLGQRPIYSTQGSDRWNGGFNYANIDDSGKTQISQSSVSDISHGLQNGDYSLPSWWDIQQVYKSALGNGNRCWYCDEHSVYDCFYGNDSSVGGDPSIPRVEVCQGQDYFCFFHERRQIGHYMNRREKYIDHQASTRNDLFLARVYNEAFNIYRADSGLGAGGVGTYLPRDTSRVTSIPHETDVLRPKTSIHVMAGCQQPQACLRQQMQNLPITIGIQFMGSHSSTANTANDAIWGANQALPTSRRNAREGLCRLGRDWTYYSGHMWNYDDTPTAATADFTTEETALDTLNAITATTLTADELQTLKTQNIADGHSFWFNRESWYDGMRPNGFPDIHYHSGKGTESVCHFCCNPASDDGWFCNRRLLDAATGANHVNTDANLVYADGAGSWMPRSVDEAGGTINNQFASQNYRRADNNELRTGTTPALGGFLVTNNWQGQRYSDVATEGTTAQYRSNRYHGTFRNPETQVYQNIQLPKLATSDETLSNWRYHAHETSDHGQP